MALEQNRCLGKHLVIDSNYKKGIVGRTLIVSMPPSPISPYMAVNTFENLCMILVILVQVFIRLHRTLEIFKSQLLWTLY